MHQVSSGEINNKFTGDVGQINRGKENKLYSKCSLGSGLRSSKCHTKELKCIEKLKNHFHHLLLHLTT